MFQKERSTCNWGCTCALSCAVTISCVSSRCSPNWLDTWHTHRPASSGLRWRMCSTSCDGVTRSVWVTGRSCPSWSLNHLHVIENNQKTRWMYKLVHGEPLLCTLRLVTLSHECPSCYNSPSSRLTVLFTLILSVTTFAINKRFGLVNKGQRRIRRNTTLGLEGGGLRVLSIPTFMVLLTLAPNKPTN